jgi:O-antigen ligase
MVAASAAVLFALVRASGMSRLAIFIGAPILAITLVSVMPDGLVTRYATLFQQDEPTAADEGLQSPDEALESRETRMYLLTTAIGLTIRNPLLGVGPGQFANVEGNTAADQGKRGTWQVSHNTYLQVSSEMGIPALIFFSAAIVATFRLFNSLYRRSRSQPPFRKLRNAAFCLMLSMVGYCTAIFFLSIAYTSYLPVMTGLAIALNRAFEHQLLSSQPAAAPATVT